MSHVNFQSVIKNKDIRDKIHPSFLQEFISYLFYFLQVFVTVALIYFFIRTSVYDGVVISGSSMFPTYEDKDVILIDLLTPKFSDYRRGDVVVLVSPIEPDGKRHLYIKRVIGLPGEKVIIDNGQIIIKNEKYPLGVPLVETNYLDDAVMTYKGIMPPAGGVADRYEEATLKEDEYYVMGDNRTRSKDSRSFGAVPKSSILGKEFYRLIPPEKAGFYALPDYNISN